jgi:hypothetical protein
VESFDPTLPKARYISACHSVLVDITDASFVDDNGLGVISTFQRDAIKSLEENQKQENIHNILGLKQLAQHWERLLFTTVGALNLQKSFWYLITWKWKGGVPRLANINHSRMTLALTSGYNTTQEEIPRMALKAAFCTLGIYISPSGSQTKQTQILRNYAQEYHEKIISAPLACMSLTQEQCRYIQAPALAGLLPKPTLTKISNLCWTKIWRLRYTRLVCRSRHATTYTNGWTLVTRR